MLSIFGINETEKRNIAYIPEAYADALEWQFRQIGVKDFQIVHCDDPDIGRFKNKPEKIKASLYDNSPDAFMTDNVAVVLSHFTSRDLYKKILPNVYDNDWDKEDDRRGRESWERNFGKDIPFGEDW